MPLSKYTHSLLLIFSFFLFSPYSYSQNKLQEQSFKKVLDKPLEKFSMGSCNKTTLPQPLWPVISSHNPELFLWLGDNVYLDTEDHSLMKSIYQDQVANKGYANFVKKTPVIGTWDDHDFGANDAGKEYPLKKESQKLLLDFLKEPLNSVRRQQKGIYTTHTYGPLGQQVRFIILDVRYHKEEPGKLESDVLGEEQWRWLDDVLAKNEAQINFVVSGISVMSASIPTSEEWSDFKLEKAKLFKMLKTHNTKGLMFLTGDRHFSACLKKKYKGDYYHELMSSGMTHNVRTKFAKTFYKAYYGKKNSYFERNFSNIEIDWSVNPIEFSFKVIGTNNKTQLKREFQLKDGNSWALKD